MYQFKTRLKEKAKAAWTRFAQWLPQHLNLMFLLDIYLSPLTGKNVKTDSVPPHSGMKTQSAKQSECTSLLTAKDVSQPCLMKEFKYSVDQVTGGWVSTLTRLKDGAEKKFFTAGSGDMSFGLTLTMNSLMDDQCLQFFPDGKRLNVKENKEVTSPDLSNVKNLKVESGKCFIKGAEVSADEFQAELTKRYGEKKSAKWREEHDRS